MLIKDLNHLDVVSEETAIVGGRRNWKRSTPMAEAFADAYSDAIGFKAFSLTYTDTQAVAGLFASSQSGSYAKATGIAVA